MTTTVAENNQVNIPPDIVQEFNIRPGTRLEWTKAGEGVITVRPLPDRGKLARQLIGAGRKWLKPGADPIGDLIRQRQHDDELDRAATTSSHDATLVHRDPHFSAIPANLLKPEVLPAK